MESGMGQKEGNWKKYTVSYKTFVISSSFTDSPRDWNLELPFTR